ncbi:MAG: site-specific integrase, partial [Treponemataceae bacterium]|nr:site-specific integrase [Treponemataceae bacterium]
MERFEKLLRQFHANLIMVEGRAELTAQTYGTAVKEFLSWLCSKEIELESVALKDLLYYLSWRKSLGNSELTIAKDISALRAFGAFLTALARKKCLPSSQRGTFQRRR